MSKYLARLNAIIQEKPLPKEPSKPSKVAFEPFEGDQGRRVSGIDNPSEPDEAELEERKGIAMGSVPERFLDAWAHLQVQKPHQVSDDGWRQAIDDAGQFFDQWGSLAADFGRTPGDLFDVPRIDGTCGLVWFLKGTRVRGLGPEHAALGNGTRAYDRIACGEWISSYTKGGYR